MKLMKAFGYVIFINILSAKTNPILTFLTPWFLLDVLCTVPLILSIFFPIIRMVWIPSFLQIWLARNLLNEVVNYVQRNSKNTHSILFYKLLQLLMTFVALVISCIGKLITGTRSLVNFKRLLLPKVLLPGDRNLASLYF